MKIIQKNGEIKTLYVSRRSANVLLIKYRNTSYGGDPVNLAKKTGLESIRKYEGALEAEIAAQTEKYESLKDQGRDAYRELTALLNQAFKDSPPLTYEELAAESEG